jgi:hypothetical protein
MRQVISLATSCGTLLGMWLAGNKRPSAWLVGLGNQALWIATIVLFSVWGLLPLSLALIVVYSRNYLRWRHEDRARCRPLPLRTHPVWLSPVPRDREPEGTQEWE